MSDSRLVDPFGRRITYLRLSVTDRCDFRCTYCMSEDMQFLPRDQVLSLEELYAVADAFIGLGVRRIRITGGEPLVRKGITGLLARLGQRAELEDLAITTNGSQLREAGFERIKLNCVVQKGRNDDEILDLVEYALANQLDISFIEEMPLGSITSHRRELTLCTSDEVRAIIERRWPLTPSLARSGGPSRYYQIGDEPSRIGFISPHSNNFCGDCNRVRVTAEGKLVLCLGHEGALDLRELLRSHPGDRERLSAALVAALNLKPERHHFDAQEQVQVLRFMSMTGG